MNSIKKTLTQLPLFLLITSIISTHLMHPMDPPHNDIFVQSEDPQTPVQIQYETEEYSACLSCRYTCATTLVLKNQPRGGALCIVKQLPNESSVLSFHVLQSSEKKQDVVAHEFDEFTIHPKVDNIIIITKKNDLKNNLPKEIIRFTFRSNN
jgi:hypothetical protein